MKFWGNNKGFSLAEILVAIGILGIIGYFVARLTVDTTNHSVKLSVRQERRDVHTEIDHVLRTAGCGIAALLNSSYETVKQIDLPNSYAPDTDNAAVIDLGGAPNNGLISPALNLDVGTKIGTLTVTNIQITGYEDQTVTPMTHKFVNINSDATMVKAQIVVTLVDHAGANRDLASAKDLSHATYSSRHPVLLSIDQNNTPADPSDDKITDCSTIAGLAYIQETCLAASGIWNTVTKKCDLNVENTGEGNGDSSFCQMAEECNVNSNYKWN